VEGVVGHLLAAELRALLGKVLEGRIFGQALLGAEAVELWVPAREAVTLEGGVGGGLFLELCEGVGAGGAFGAAEEGHDGCVCRLMWFMLLCFQDGVSRSMVGLRGSRLVVVPVVTEDVKICVLSRDVQECVWNTN
jgi:hypothetical protein